MSIFRYVGRKIAERRQQREHEIQYVRNLLRIAETKSMGILGGLNAAEMVEILKANAEHSLRDASDPETIERLRKVLKITPRRVSAAVAELMRQGDIAEVRDPDLNSRYATYPPDRKFFYVRPYRIAAMNAQRAPA